MGERSMTDWKSDKSWSDAYLPTVKAILGQCLIGEASREDDQERNTDLIVLKMDAVRIACRLRRPGYLDNYGPQFTIRFTRPSGVKSEFAKIIEGWGDYFFYGFANEHPPVIDRWFVGDLKAFRLHVMMSMNKNGGRIPADDIPNEDGSSRFLAFKCQTMPKEFFVVSSR